MYIQHARDTAASLLSLALSDGKKIIVKEESPIQSTYRYMYIYIDEAAGYTVPRTGGPRPAGASDYFSLSLECAACLARAPAYIASCQLALARLRRPYGLYSPSLSVSVISVTRFGEQIGYI